MTPLAKVTVWTGNGKGKTTSALGLCFRLFGEGKRVAVFQFRKGMESGERAALGMLGIPVWVCGEGRKGPPCGKPCRLLLEAVRILREERPDVMLLDEIMAAVRNSCVSVGEALEIISEAGADMEIVLTGRNVPEELLSRADSVTSAEPVRHYWANGIRARRGIEY